MKAVRTVLSVAGLALLVLGAWLLLVDTRQGTVPQVALWLAGSVALHDFVLVPLILLAGLALKGTSARTVWRGALLTGGTLTLLALPLMLRDGATAGKPSLLPLNYPLNWAIALAGTAVGMVCVLLVRTVRTARTGRRHRNGRS
jgi:hypothetical protein